MLRSSLGVLLRVISVAAVLLSIWAAIASAASAKKFSPKRLWVRTASGTNGRVPVVPSRKTYSEYISDSVVYFPDGSTVTALDQATGAVEWTYESNGEINTNVVVSSSTVFFGTSGGMWHAVTRQDGKKRWHFRASYKVINGDAALSRNEKVVCVGSYENEFFCLNAESGDVLWKREFPRSQGVLAGGAAMDGSSSSSSSGQQKQSTTVFVPTALEGRSSGVTALDLSSSNNNDSDGGEVKWTTRVGSIEHRLVYDSDNNLVLCSVDEVGLVALDAKTGTRRWKFSNDDGVGASPVVVDGVVYVGHKNYVAAIDVKTGKTKWQQDKKMGDLALIRPVVVGDVVIVASKKRIALLDKESGKMKHYFPSTGDAGGIAASGAKIFIGTWGEGDVMYALDISEKVVNVVEAPGGDL